MSEEARTKRLPVVAVLGGSIAEPEHLEMAGRVGAMAAEKRWVVLTGGGAGVMAAASRGAVTAGGLTVGVLPVAQETEAYPNPWVMIPLFTGAGSARNAFNVLSADLCVAIGGGAGTLSEIALALKAGVPVWTWRSWRLEPPKGPMSHEPVDFSTGDELLEALARRFAEYF